MQEIKESEWFSDVNWGVIDVRSYGAPIQLDLYKCYIHEEFLREDVEELNMAYGKANVSEPLFEFFKFEKNSCPAVLYGREKAVAPRNNGSIRHATETSNKDSLKCNNKKQLQQINVPQKPFVKSGKKISNNTNLTNTSVRPTSNHINSSTIAESQPKEVKKKITLMKKLDKENEQSCERNASNTPKSRSLKKLTVISSKNFTSKRQSDSGQEP